MKKAWRFLGILLVVVFVPGCADNPQTITHDMIVFWNEVCDNMLKATDEETAKKLLEVQFKVLEKKHETIRLRAEKKFTNFDKDDAMDVENALMDFKVEIEAVEQRLKNTKERVLAIIAQMPNPDSCINLKKIANWADSGKKVFNVQDYGKYMPNLRTKDVKPKQLGKGLVPARPNFEFKKQAP